VLQAGHVAPEAELLAVKSFQILLPSCDLSSNLASALRLGHDRQLQFGHVLQFVILHQRIARKKKILKNKNTKIEMGPEMLMGNIPSFPVWKRHG
jgi:hypothetical protein